MKKAKLLVFLTATVFVLLISNPLCYAQCGGNYGDVMDTFMGVRAHSNGACISTIYGYHQCAVFVQEFCQVIYKKAIYNVGYAYNMYNKASEQNFYPYPNNGPVKPKIGAVLCFSGGVAGHVAIIKNVNTNSITLIEENWSSTQANRQLPLAYQNGGWYVESNSNTYKVQGWIFPDPAGTFDISKYSSTYTCHLPNGLYVVGKGGGTYYYIQDGKKRPINGGYLAGRKITSNRVITLSDDSLNSIPTGDNIKSYQEFRGFKFSDNSYYKLSLFNLLIRINKLDNDNLQ